MLGGSGNKVWNNEATDCFVGLVVESDKNSITWNAVKENFGPGLVVFGAQNLLIGNTASRNGEFGQIGEDDGIVVVGTGNMLVANAANNNVGKGFCVAEGNVNWGLNLAWGNGVEPQVDFHCDEVSTLSAAGLR